MGTCTDDVDLPEHVKLLFDNSSALLNEQDKPKLKVFMREYADIFSRDYGDIGQTNLVKHKIYTGDAPPKKLSPRKLGLEASKASDDLIDDLLDGGLIKPSKSPWSAPIDYCYGEKEKWSFSHVHRLPET